MRKILILLLLVVFSASAQDERIHHFHSEIKVKEDGSMLVRETIKVTALGRKIKRGIFRDFPTKYKDEYGNNYKVKFKIKSTKSGPAACS